MGRSEVLVPLALVGLLAPRAGTPIARVCGRKFRCMFGLDYFDCESVLRIVVWFMLVSEEQHKSDSSKNCPLPNASGIRKVNFCH